LEILNFVKFIKHKKEKLTVKPDIVDELCGKYQKDLVLHVFASLKPISPH
jgi:hypothetical protein